MERREPEARKRGFSCLFSIPSVIFQRGVHWRRAEPQEWSAAVFHKTGAIVQEPCSLRCTVPECRSMDDTMVSRAMSGTGTLRKRSVVHGNPSLRQYWGSCAHKPLAKCAAMAMPLCTERGRGTLEREE